MMNQLRNDAESSNGTKKSETYLLTTETYERIRQAQQRIQEVTEIVPKMRKIINDILNADNIERYITQFIEKYR